MTLLGMGVAMATAQLRSEFSHFVSHYEQQMKLNALIFSVVTVVVRVCYSVNNLGRQYNIV